MLNFCPHSGKDDHQADAQNNLISAWLTWSVPNSYLHPVLHLLCVTPGEENLISWLAAPVVWKLDLLWHSRSDERNVERDAGKVMLEQCENGRRGLMWLDALHPFVHHALMSWARLWIQLWFISADCCFCLAVTLNNFFPSFSVLLLLLLFVCSVDVRLYRQPEERGLR